MPNPDYVITKVRYDDDHSRITDVKRGDWDNEDGKFTNVTTTPRGTVVSSIEDDNQHYTVPPKDDGDGYKWGDEVGVMEIDGEKFIRTDGNEVANDNLGGLPEF